MEKIKTNRRGVAAASLSMSALFLAGCAGHRVVTEEVPAPVPEVTERVYVGDSGSGLNITTNYYANGTRSVYIEESSVYGSTIHSYCDGGDLVEVATLYEGGGMSRSIGHVACADNRLTPADFPPLPQ